MPFLNTIELSLDVLLDETPNIIIKVVLTTIDGIVNLPIPYIK